MKINVTSEQVINGLHYKGVIKCDNREFNYILKFGVHIEQLDSQKAQENDPDKMFEFASSLFKFSLYDGEEEIKIDQEVFCFLLNLAGNVTLSLFNEPQSQASNNTGMMSSLLDPENSLSEDIGIEISISLSSSFEVSLDSIPNILK